MAISALPTPPSRLDTPATFSSKADALLGALPAFVTEANALAVDVTAKELAVSSNYSAAMAAGLANSASNAATATAQAAAASGSASTASTGASTATTQAAAALVSATAASNIVLGVSTTLPAIRPSLMLDFCNSRSVDPRITVTRPGSGTRVNHLGSVVVEAANMPRLDYDPVTLACKGLLIEEARTNTIRNSKNTGATVGVVGSGGVIPTYWAVTGSPGTVVREVIGTGVIDGAEYIDLRLSGTTSTTNFGYAFEPSTGGVSGTIGQTWTEGVSVALIGGSLSNVGYIKLQLTERDGAGAGLASYGVTDIKSLLTPSLSRHVITYALVQAGTTQAQPNILVGWTSTGVAVDITLRLSAPQLELGAFATSHIPTSGSQVTKAVESDVLSGANFSSWYRQDEFSCVARFFANSSGTRTYATFSDGTANERVMLQSISGALSLTIVDGGVTQASISLGSVVTDTSYSVAVAWKLNDIAASINGAAVVTDSAATLPVVDRLHIGSDHAGANQSCKQCMSLSGYPKRLTNLELQSLSTP